jgi:hypothetical protein
MTTTRAHLADHVDHTRRTTAEIVHLLLRIDARDNNTATPGYDGQYTVTDGPVVARR